AAFFSAEVFICPSPARIIGERTRSFEYVSQFWTYDVLVSSSVRIEKHVASCKCLRLTRWPRGGRQRASALRLLRPSASMSISDAGSAVARGHELQILIDEVYEKHLPHTTGEVATYIPELSKADPEAFGVCLVTADGRTFEAGDCARPFTIQSISKPFTYGMALEEFGPTKVFEHVGVEPSGGAFNSIELPHGRH